MKLQRYKDGKLNDAYVFKRTDGLSDSNGRVFGIAELKEYVGERGQAGRVVPRGFAKSLRFA